MDVPYMVLPGAIALLRSPALRFAVLGALGRVLTGSGGSTPASGNGIRSSISFAKVALVYNQIAREKGRPLTSEERAEALDIILNREALFLYSREIGLDRDPVVQRAPARHRTDHQCDQHVPGMGDAGIPQHPLKVH